MRRALITACAALLAMPAAAQDHSMHMPGMMMPAKKPPVKKPVRKPPQKEPAAKAPVRKAAPKTAPAMPAMDHAAMPGMDHGAPPAAAHDMAASVPSGTALPAGSAPAPAPPGDHYADRAFPAAAMARARGIMMREGGEQRFAQAFFNIAELAPRRGRDGYRWDGEAWFGGDRNRLVVKTEGEGALGGDLDHAEVQALFSRAIGPYYNVQGGVRQDFARGADRTWASLGVEGLAPYMFETEATAFISDKGEVAGRLEGWYDQRITQRLILQPRGELNFAAQNSPATRVGAGLSDVELGLRLRYEIAREFAPYVGVSWAAKAGRSADYARADGDDPSTIALVAGIRFWF